MSIIAISWEHTPPQHTPFTPPVPKHLKPKNEIYLQKNDSILPLYIEKNKGAI